MLNKQLHRLDLNTLLALDALLDLKHVSHAAERMNLSQPAMSRILAKLREAFDDPLLLRVHAQHQLSERAQALQQPLKRILQDIEELLLPLVFDPATCRRTFRIALTDFSSQVFLPQVLQQIYKEAPQVNIETVSLRADMLSTETFEQIDVCICSPQWYGPTDLNVHKLFSTSTTVLMANQHPLAQGELTLDGFLQYPHVEVDLGGNEGTLIDSLLKQQGRFRRVGLRSVHVTSILPIVANTNLLFSIAWQLLSKSFKSYGLVSKEIPLEIPLAEYCVLWHPRDQDSAANSWLRELIIQVALEKVWPDSQS